MKKREALATIVGLSLIGAVIVLIRSEPVYSISSNTGADTPVAELADELKEAWSSHHTVA